MQPRFDPILFDLDGTLIDSSRDIANAVNTTLVRHDMPTLPEETIVGFVGDGVRKLVERTLKQVGRGDLDEMVKAVKDQYRQNCLVHTRPYPGIPALLEALSPANLAVVTNKVSDFARIILDGLGLSAFFATVVGGDETERIKPHPDPVLLACSRMGVEPVSGIFIGDYRNDIGAGKSSGMTTCGVLWGFDGGRAVREAGADHLCDTVGDLEKLLLNP
jgi:phosphoglycolate phosphatase